MLDDDLKEAIFLSEKTKKAILSETFWATLLVVFLLLISSISIFLVLLGKQKAFLSEFNITPLVSNAIQMLHLLIGIIPLWFLYQYSTKLKAAIRASNSTQFGEALRWKKRVYMFYVIYAIVLILIATVSIIILINRVAPNSI